jgi:hypothetical protein
MRRVWACRTPRRKRKTLVLSFWKKMSDGMSTRWQSFARLGDGGDASAGACRRTHGTSVPCKLTPVAVSSDPTRDTSRASGRRISRGYAAPMLQIMLRRPPKASLLLLLSLSLSPAIDRGALRPMSSSTRALRCHTTNGVPAGARCVGRNRKHPVWETSARLRKFFRAVGAVGKKIIFSRAVATPSPESERGRAAPSS